MRPVDAYWGHFSAKSLGISTNRSKRSESRGPIPSCAATNDSTHQPAALRDFNPAFVRFGSERRSPVTTVGEKPLKGQRARRTLLSRRQDLADLRISRSLCWIFARSCPDLA